MESRVIFRVFGKKSFWVYVFFGPLFGVFSGLFAARPPHFRHFWKNSDFSEKVLKKGVVLTNICKLFEEFRIFIQPGPGKREKL